MRGNEIRWPRRRPRQGHVGNLRPLDEPHAESALMIIESILKRVHILRRSGIMPFDGFEMTLSDSIEAYWALVPTTVLSSLQIVQDAREAVDLDVCPSQYTNS